MAAGVDMGVVYEEMIARIGETAIRPGACVVDGGAYHGMHTIPFAKLAGSAGVVHAFEPIPEILEINAAAARRAGVASIVRYHYFALWDTPGLSTFHVAVGEEPYSSLRLRVPGKTYRPILAACGRLDDVLRDRPVDFMKLDVEGAEIHALRGGEAVLRRSDPLIVFENGRATHAEAYGYSKEAFFGFFADLGFTLWDAFGHSFAGERWEDPEAGWYFFAFRPGNPRGTAALAAAQDFWRGYAV